MYSSRRNNPQISGAEWRLTCRKDVYPSWYTDLEESVGDEGRLAMLNTLVGKKLQVGREQKVNADKSVEINGSNELVEFKLLSRARPTIISLKEKPVYKVVALEKPMEDTLEEANKRRQQAMEAAVDHKFVLDQRSVPYLPRPSSSNKTFRYQLPRQLEASAPLPELIVTERALTDSGKGGKGRAMADIRACPVVRMHIPINVRRTKFAQKPIRKSVQFFRPDVEWGGKSRGYAMGYEGSWAADKTRREDKKYVRDKMTKACLP